MKWNWYSKPADSNYSKELQQKINAAIQRERDIILKQREESIVRKILDSKKINFFEDAICHTLITNPSILDQHSSIKMKLEDFIKKTKINTLFVLKPYLSLVKILQDDKQIALAKCKITFFLLNYFEELKKDDYFGFLRRDIFEVCRELNLKHVEEKFLTKTIPTMLKHQLVTIHPAMTSATLRTISPVVEYLTANKKVTDEIRILIFQILNKIITPINHTTKIFNLEIAHTLSLYLITAKYLNAQFPNIIPFKQQRELISLHLWAFQTSAVHLDLTNAAFLDKDKDFFIKVVESYGYDNIQQLKDRFVTFFNWQVEAILEKHPLSDQKNIDYFIKFISDHSHYIHGRSRLNAIVNRLYTETKKNYDQYRKKIQDIFPEITLSHPTSVRIITNYFDTQDSTRNSIGFFEPLKINFTSNSGGSRTSKIVKR